MPRREVIPNAAAPQPKLTGPMRHACAAQGDSIPIVSRAGSMNVTALGTNRASLRSMAWFHYWQELSWLQLFGLLGSVYFCVTVVLASVYYLIATMCGAHVTWVIALYFNAVSLSSNGGYLGEDPMMIDPTTSCYAYRTWLVLLECFVNIAVAGIISAMCVMKVQGFNKLKHHIVFSNFCAASEHDYDESGDDHEKVAFRVGSLHRTSLIGGHLRVFAITQESAGDDSPYIQQAVKQLDFTTPEESHQQSGQVLLWTPVTVVIPLAKNPSLREAVMHDEPRAAAVQIVALFQATDPVTGATIEASHSYQMKDVIRGYRFSTNTVCGIRGRSAAALPEGSDGYEAIVDPGDADRLAVDFLGFNEMVQVDEN